MQKKVLKFLGIAVAILAVLASFTFNGLTYVKNYLANLQLVASRNTVANILGSLDNQVKQTGGVTYTDAEGKLVHLIIQK